MGSGRRRSGGGGGGSGGGRNQRLLKHHIDTCNKKFSTTDDIVHHLRNSYPNYRRMELKTLTRIVQQTLNQQTPPPKKFRKHELETESDSNDEEANLSTPVSKKQRRIDESEEKLMQIENSYSRRRNRNRSPVLVSSSDTESSSESDSGSDSSTSLESPKFDLMKSMLRESYGLAEKNMEVELANDRKESISSKVDMIERNRGVGKQKGEDLVVSLGKLKGVLGEDAKGKEGGPRFKDLGGLSGILEELEMEVFLPLYHPNVPLRLGVSPISGILLHGPPGCGKTKLAHAIANETGVPFYKISATEVVSGVSGASEENIRDLFSKAYRTAPSIIFIDEIDAIASKRENLQREMERRIVTQLMTCMDEHHGLGQPSDDSSSSESSNRIPGNVLVIGATNRPDAVDPALRRPGRFDREINLGVPDEKARVQILSVLTKSCTLEGSLDILQIARSTPGFVGADLNALVNMAGNLAMRRVASQRKSELSGQLIEKEENEDWWKKPWSPEEMEKLAITMADFEKAAKLVQPSSKREGFSSIPNVKWEDVGGLDDIRDEFDLYIISRIKYPDDYQKFGVNLETGILLYGPPGCGKTMIAKAAANEAGANFIHGPELLNKYVGESELAVRTLFSRARTCSPCIIFFDEVDALTTMRGKEGGWVVERLLNQLLIELDGADQRPGIFIIGATNRPEVMDPAVLRPGRFGKLIHVPLPSSEDRGLILKALAKGKPIDPSVDLAAIGQMEACKNFSGADLRKLMEEAAMTALKEAKRQRHLNETSATQNEPSVNITATHFEQALGKISPSVSEKMKKQYSISSFSFFILFLHCTNTFAQTPAAAPAQAPAAVVAQPPAATPTQAAAPNGITNVTKILEKAGHFTIFIRLLRSTQEENHLFSALNGSSSGLTIFAPTDSAFSELKSGTLNTLSDGDKSELVKFHVVPTFLSTSQFQTVSNPLGTWAGTGSRLPLNVTSYPNSVNITTGLTNTSLSGTVYTDNQLAIYKIEKVLLPKDVFGSKAPAPAPAAPAREKPTKAVPEATVESPVSPVDISGALMFTHNNVVGSVGITPAAAPAQAPAAVVAQPPAATPTQAAAPNGITNVTKILEKAGHFTIFIRLLRSTQEENHLFSALNGSSSGLTIFAPTDSAFSELKSGTLNTLSDGDKSELVKFHVVPTFLSTSQFQTVSNPLGTWAGTGSRLPLNVTSYPNSVNITTGLTNTSLSGTVYTDNQLAIYKIEKVLLPKDVFGSKAPAPAPAAPAREKPTKAVPEATVESPVSPVDISGALMFTHNNVVGSVGMMKKQYSISSFSVFILFLHCSNTFAQTPAAAPAQAPAAVVAQPPAATPTQAAAPNGITNVTKILEKAGHFTIFIRLLRSTQEENHLFSALNDSSSGLTIFAPTDSAFSELKSGTLNTLSDGDKSELVKFHVVPTFLSISQFQTVSNPLGTWAGTGSRLPLNVTSYPNSVNITTGLTNTSLSGTVYTDNQLAIYKIEKVLLPKDVFGSKAPAPAPAAPAREKPTKAVPEATVESPVSPVDISSALMFTHNNVVGSVSMAPAAVTAQPPAVTPTHQAAAPHDIINVTKIREKAGHFTIFIRLLRSTQEENHLFSALNDSSSGLTIFAPTDSAFSELKSGTLNTLRDGDKSELVKFHVVPTFLSTSQFQTVSNPLGTWAGTGSRLPLNVTSYPHSMNITTGLTNTSLSGTIYTDNQLAIYKIEKVLLPKDIFASNAPAPAPVQAPTREKPTKAVPAANVDSPVAPVDISSAVTFMHINVVGSLVIVAAAMMHARFLSSKLKDFYGNNGSVEISCPNLSPEMIVFSVWKCDSKTYLADSCMNCAMFHNCFLWQQYFRHFLHFPSINDLAHCLFSGRRRALQDLESACVLWFSAARLSLPFQLVLLNLQFYIPFQTSMLGFVFPRPQQLFSFDVLSHNDLVLKEELFELN
uniref:FAS1 domain-containing protein n=1 Tax=Salix viminalis TaxID=40686 RepID=A0A6N2LZV3_SALVM